MIFGNWASVTPCMEKCEICGAECPRKIQQNVLVGVVGMDLLT